MYFLACLYTIAVGYIGVKHQIEWVQEPPASSGNLWYPEGMMVKSGHGTVDANPQTLIFSQLGGHWQRRLGGLDFQHDETSIVDRHRYHMAAKFGSFFDEDHSKLPTLYWLLNFINGPINYVLLLILVHVQLLSCLFFLLLALLRLRTMSLNIAQLFMKEMVKNYFGLLKKQVKFLIN